jgi:hypothetical protein
VEAADSSFPGHSPHHDRRERGQGVSFECVVSDENPDNEATRLAAERA